MDPLLHDDPEHIAGFTLLSRLGSGGMGTVYLARAADGRTVALKTVHAHYVEQAEFRARFHLEVDAARVIGDRYGATVIAADPMAGNPWLATEYVLGPPLDEAVERFGPLPAAAVRALGAALCRALAKLHESDVVHRDLKPSNVLLSARGPKLIDFGVARAVGDESWTRTGAVAGTPAFMSPEQASGAEHTSASDMFALAGVLLFAATGRAPFGHGQAADLLYRVRHTEPNLSGVPVGLGPVLHRCFTQDPRQRPTASELVHHLERDAEEFVDVLPYAVFGDISARAERIWRVTPERLAAPQSEPATVSSGPSRRTTLGMAVGAAIGVGGIAWGAHVLAGGDGGKAGASGAKASSSPSPSGPPRLAWRIAQQVNSLYPLSAVGDFVTAITDDGVLAVDAATGKEIWTIEQLISGNVLTDGKRLFVAVSEDSESLYIRPVNVRTGRLGSALGAIDDVDGRYTECVALAGDDLYLTTDKDDSEDTRALVRVDLRTGEVVMETTYSVADGYATEVKVALAGDRLVLSGRNQIAVADIDTGEVLWSRKLPKARTPAKVNYPGEFALAGDHVICGSGELTALRLDDGKVSWRFGEGREFGKGENSTNRYFAPPTVVGGLVYSCERGKGVVVVNAKNGALEWAEENPSVSSAMERAPLVDKELVYATPEVEQLWVHAVSRKTHTAAWDFQGPQPASSGKLLLHREHLVMFSGPETLCAAPVG